MDERARADRRRQEKLHAQRNQNPHKAAVLAMFTYSAEYADQGGGSMDFWDKLPEARKILCRECVKRIERAPNESEV